MVKKLSNVANPNIDTTIHHHFQHLDGSELSLIWVIPFVGMLLSIAIFPLLAPKLWHRHFGKISFIWAASFLIPFFFKFGYELTLYEIIHVALLEYFPFIILLLALFTASGGVRLTGELKGSPTVNTVILCIGTILASWMGTTGAAMLLIRPLINANIWRKHQVHTVVFFIFLVANIGGGLTPLGDPPLFLGFLKGVEFFWTTQYMFLPTLTVSVILLAIFFILDSYLYKKEDQAKAPKSKGNKKLGLEGKVNLLLVLAIIASVLMSGIWKPEIYFNIYHVDVGLQNIVRDLLLLSIVVVSLLLTSKESRKENGFTWFPIVEVGKLFAAIFLTIIPAIAILKSGSDGALGFVIDAVFKDSQPINSMFFWYTGILSAFLDNAPTYLVFFNTAGGDAQILMGALSATLLAISAGAVFMGAITYIGNAPNFMVRSIAEQYGVKMPSFFGYMVWSCCILVPIFILITFLFFT